MFLESFPVKFPDELNFKEGLMAETIYRDLYNEIAPVIVHRLQMSMPEALSRRMCIPGKYIECDPPAYNESSDKRFTHGRIVTPRGLLPYEEEERKDIQTVWHIRPPVRSLDELIQVFEVPFSFDEAVYEVWYDRYKKLLNEMGNNGVVFLDLPSPIVAISDLMELELFLELSLTENNLFHEILAEITRRMLLILSGLLDRYDIFEAGYLGGSEQCTPPMMRPESFDEYVEPYDGQIVELFKKHGLPVHMHSHGRVRHSLARMVRMGISSTDPVEHPPGGDLEFEEAIKIANNKLTLVGNLNFDELEFAPKEQIIKRARDVLRFKGQRVILSSSGGPISKVSPKLAENYRALLETYLKFR